MNTTNNTATESLRSYFESRIAKCDRMIETAREMAVSLPALGAFEREQTASTASEMLMGNREERNYWMRRLAEV